MSAKRALSAKSCTYLTSLTHIETMPCPQQSIATTLAPIMTVLPVKSTREIKQDPLFSKALDGQ